MIKEQCVQAKELVQFADVQYDVVATAFVWLKLKLVSVVPVQHRQQRLCRYCLGVLVILDDVCGLVKSAVQYVLHYLHLYQRRRHNSFLLYRKKN